uniref:Col_cuticle_N domain-containing protein n=1 Tax=Caenorhabditis tropicalis TaxID=1561998 RepID=A0A1I7TS27_9PELO
MSQPVTSAVVRRNYRKEAIVAVAAVGVVIIVWNLRDKIANFWNSLGSSCSSSNSAPVSEREKTAVDGTKAAGEETPKPAEVAPEALKESTEKTEDPAAQAPPKDTGANSAPESTEKPMGSSVYVNLPKTDPAAVSSSLPPSNWPGATPR